MFLSASLIGLSLFCSSFPALFFPRSVSFFSRATYPFIRSLVFRTSSQINIPMQEDNWRVILYGRIHFGAIDDAIRKKERRKGSKPLRKKGKSVQGFHESRESEINDKVRRNSGLTNKQINTWEGPIGKWDNCATRGPSGSLSLSPFVLRTLTRLTSYEAGSAEACYRWTYVTIDGSIGQSSSCYICVCWLHRVHTVVPSPSFVPLVAIEITQRVRRGAPRNRHRLPHYSQWVYIRVIPFVSLFMKSWGERRKEGISGWTEIESLRDSVRPGN